MYSRASDQSQGGTNQLNFIVPKCPLFGGSTVEINKVEVVVIILCTDKGIITASPLNSA